MKATIAALALASLAESAAITIGNETVEPKADGKSFTLNQIANSKFTAHDGPKAFMRAHMKYGKTLPPAVMSAVQTNAKIRAKFQAITQADRSKGTVEALPDEDVDSEYAVVVDIGTPAQSIPLNLDTGSADLWTFSSDTPSKMVENQTLYKPDDSSTSKALDGQKWFVKYGDGAGASGKVYLDKVQVGDTYFDKQAIESATWVSDDIASDSFVSGIFGLANSNANTIKPDRQKTYIDNIQDQLAMPLFTANLKRQRPGNYNFGYINESEYTGEIQWAQVNPYSPFWEVTVNGYKIGDSDHDMSFNGIVDTGTSLLLIPQRVVDRYYSKVEGAAIDSSLGMFVFPCSSKLPDFTLKVGDHRGKIPGEYINYGQASPTYCFGGIQSAKGIPFSVLGDVFLKAQFAVFDYGDGLVGLANKELTDLSS